ncbi:hypothetical protein [Streptomyces sp. RTGN2]|uniref:hypothetical protein n=1 Tax=Streptomyces sp. RTGN2 TaxID=3016525 RepID=UPI00255366F5|nr:hypothetical protein [Streptomyces sp. RTGN2]
MLDLTGSERAVALYASDMPSGRRRHSSEQIREWIVQGAELLGVEEIRSRAEFRYGHRLLEMSGLVTPQIQQRHEQQFPKAGRLRVAEQQSSNSICGDGMSEEARLRNTAAKVDGDCPCRGTRRIRAVFGEGEDQPAMLCPVHAQAAIRRHHASYRQSADQRDEARHTPRHTGEQR